MLGTRGVPARYGGFETAVEEIGSRLASRGHDVVVYCRNRDQDLREYRGMRLVNVGAIRTRSFETLSHTGLSSLHSAVARPDVALVFNSANAPFVGFLRAVGVPCVVHTDGLEWKRAKWAGGGALYYRFAERMAMRVANEVIADARAIGDHIRSRYGRSSWFIPYGAPIVGERADLLVGAALRATSYHLVVARFEPENNVDLIVRGYVQSQALLPLVVVGGAPYAASHSRAIAAAAEGDERVKFLGLVWDQELLDQLYANCASYLHGHSVGGTNPSLLRAMGAGAPVTAYDVIFNREVTGELSRFFASEQDVSASVEADEADPVGAKHRGEALRERASAVYSWDAVADEYERLCLHVSGRGGPRT